tara:strand:+ start:375 stop:659 length:285 start_codon:yes stop_codon:yes gene_type:complete
MKFEKFKLVNLNKTIECPICQNNTFGKRKILLNTRGMSYFELDAFNKTATVLKCQKCGHYHWFDKNVAQLERYSKLSSKSSSSKIRRTKKKRKK